MGKRSRPPSAPRIVILMMTRRCNLRCLHCSADSEQFSRGDLSTNELLSIIEELARCKIFRVVLTGGEPLIHPDFDRVCRAIVERPLHLQINTNATLVVPRVADALARLPRRPVMSVSIDGVTAETHDAIRGAGSFVRMKRGVELLRTAGLRVRMFMVLSTLNYRELPAVAAFAASIGTSKLNVTTPVGCGRAVHHVPHIMPQGDELREALEITLPVMESHPGLIRGPWGHAADLYADLKRGRIEQAVRNDDRLFHNCGAAWNQAAIASDGTVAACDMAFACAAGNLRDQSLLDIWHGSPVFKSMRECTGMPLSEVTGCERCR